MSKHRAYMNIEPISLVASLSIYFESITLHGIVY